MYSRVASGGKKIFICQGYLFGALSLTLEAFFVAQNMVQRSTEDTHKKFICIVICRKKLTLAHDVFCCTRADILKPTLDRTLVAPQLT